MAAESDERGWLEDFTHVLSPEQLRRERSDPTRYEVFTGSKRAAAAWASLAAAVGGAFGGLIVSSALWSSWLYPPVWLVALVVAWMATGRPATAWFGSAIRFLTGWAFFWGFLIGLCAMWGAEREASGTAYAIAGGLGFLIGITGGIYEPPDFKKPDALFGLAMALAPLSAIATVWCWRNLVATPELLAAPALAGAAAGLVFLAPQMWLIAANWENEGGLRRLAALHLHGEESDKAIGLLTQAMAIKPDEARLHWLRGFAYALGGEEAKAEADWQRHAALDPKSVDVVVARAMLKLRQGDPAAAIAPLETAVRKNPKHERAQSMLGLARHRSGDLDGAIVHYRLAAELGGDALTWTRLAEAQFEAGRPDDALQSAEVAIDEADSTHARSWMVRAKAHLALGHIAEAQQDFREAMFQAGDKALEKAAEAELDALVEAHGVLYSDEDE